MTDIICKKCGSVNDYRTELKANNQVAYCNSCGAYIKNIPYAEPALYFGKYKGIPLNDVTDLQYLKWAVVNATMSAGAKTAVQKRIDELEHLAK